MWGFKSDHGLFWGGKPMDSWFTWMCQHRLQYGTLDWATECVQRTDCWNVFTMSWNPASAWLVWSTLTINDFFFSSPSSLILIPHQSSCSFHFFPFSPQSHIPLSPLLSLVILLLPLHVIRLAPSWSTSSHSPSLPPSSPSPAALLQHQQCSALSLGEWRESGPGAVSPLWGCSSAEQPPYVPSHPIDPNTFFFFFFSYFHSSG